MIVSAVQQSESVTHIHISFLFYFFKFPDPAIQLLGIYTEETRIERGTSTPMFIAALFIIARTWKQRRCPSADEGLGLGLGLGLEYESCSTYTQWSITQPLKRIHLNQF